MEIDTQTRSDDVVQVVKVPRPLPRENTAIGEFTGVILNATRMIEPQISDAPVRVSMNYYMYIAGSGALRTEGDSVTTGVDLDNARRVIPDAWFTEAVRLNAIGETAAALDVVFDRIDDWLCEGKFEECDKFLGRLKVEETPTRLLLAILTVTYAAFDRLENRDEVFKRTWLALVFRGEDANRLLGNRHRPHGATR